jgi:hypothetical protein
VAKKYWVGMVEQKDFDTIRRDAERLFRMRVSFALNTAAFVLAILITEGALIFRWRLLLTVWLVVWMLHGVVLALYEIREGDVRQAAEALRIKRKRDEGTAGAFGLGEDGELVRLADDGDEAEQSAPAFKESAARKTSKGK